MRNKDVISYLGLWESIHNENFKGVEFDTFKNEAGSNKFKISLQKWIIGMISKSGNNGGTYARSDIALEFASWLSPKFKSRINLICEFTPLDEEYKLRYINYQIQEFKENIDKNSIKHKKIPDEINIEYKDTDDLRELKNRVYNKMMEYIE